MLYWKGIILILIKCNAEFERRLTGHCRGGCCHVRSLCLGKSQLILFENPSVPPPTTPISMNFYQKIFEGLSVENWFGLVSASDGGCAVRSVPL